MDLAQHQTFVERVQPPAGHTQQVAVDPRTMPETHDYLGVWRG